jgi:hypothetical protein
MARLVVAQLSRTLFILISKLYELGGFESGLVAYLLGLVFAVVSGRVGTMLVVLAVAVIWPQIRKYGRLDTQGGSSSASRGETPASPFPYPGAGVFRVVI